jgi:hypothetical protein
LSIFAKLAGLAWLGVGFVWWRFKR